MWILLQHSYNYVHISYQTLFYIRILLAGVLKDTRNGTEEWDCSRWKEAWIPNGKMDILLGIFTLNK